MAVLVFGLFALGLYMVELSYYDDWYHRAPDIHRSIGMLLLFLLLFRLFWRLINPRPAIVGSHLENKIAPWMHRGHYLLMFAVLISGYLISTAAGRGVDVFEWFTIPALFPADKGRESDAGYLHELLAWGMMVYVTVHAGAALKHHFYNKDHTLLRIFGVSKYNQHD